MNTILRRLSLPLVISVALVALHASASDATAELDRQLAREPAEIVTMAGRTVRGTLDGFRDGRLHVRRAIDGGEVGHSFAPAEIARLTMPGLELEADALELLDRGDIDRAMPVLEALGRHRIRYLPVLDASRQRFLWLLVEHGPAAGDPPTVLGVVRAMAPIADTPEKQVLLLEAGLEIALRMDTGDDAQDLARRWCLAADPSGRSALGWRVLAAAAYQRGDYESVRWLALQPVTFAGHLAMRDLDRCYALAIAAADRQGDVAHARLLRREMAARHLPWPDDPGLAALGEHYATTDPDQPAHAFFPPEPLTPIRPSSSTEPTLDQARRLFLPPPPP